MVVLKWHSAFTAHHIFKSLHPAHHFHHFGHAAALKFLHHVTHLLVLFEHFVDFLHRQTRALSDAAFATGFDEFGFDALKVFWMTSICWLGSRLAKQNPETRWIMSML